MAQRRAWQVCPKQFLALVLAVVFAAGGCVAPPTTTKAAKYPAHYEEHPLVIMALPPVNNTTSADAKEYYATTIIEPFARSGYYVIPFNITADILKSQGLYDTEMIGDQPVAKFGEFFGADAVLFTQINKWDTSYVVLASSLTVSVTAKLKSTKSERVLWEYTGTMVVDLSGRSNSGNALADLIAAVVVTAINTAAADYVPYAMKVNYFMLNNMPAGKYHPNFEKDRETKIFDQKTGTQRIQ